jgi:DNA-binding NarL/FixJ family response regulator
MSARPQVAVLRGASFLEKPLTLPLTTIDVTLDARFDYDGLARLEGSHAEYVVLDLRGLRGSPAAPMAAVRVAMPAAKIVVVGTAGDDAMAQAALRGGAIGYVSRNPSPESIADAILGTSGGSMHLNQTGQRAFAKLALVALS